MKEIERTKKATTVEVEIFFVDGKPTCMAWYGSKERAAMRCQFLEMEGMKQIEYCTLLRQHIHPCPGEFMSPLKNCPLHHPEGTNA